MIYRTYYLSPLGRILLAAVDIGLIGVWFEGQKYFANTLPKERISEETQVLAEAKKWLDLYFSGQNPTFTPPLHPAGSFFRQAVWKILLQIPYGHTMTYGEIARELAEKQKRSHSLLYAPLHGFPAIKLLYISPSSPHPMVRKGNRSTDIYGHRTEYERTALMVCA